MGGVSLVKNRFVWGIYCLRGGGGGGKPSKNQICLGDLLSEEGERIFYLEGSDE